jgi:hypothetical protein
MLIDSLKAAAKQALQRDGYLVNVFFLCQSEALLIDPQQTSMFDRIYGDNLNSEDSKTRSVYCMGALAKQVGANRLIMIWDGAMRTAPENFKYNETEAPLTYPKSMRTECIIINEILFDTGKDNTIIIPYKGGDGDPVEFLENKLEGISPESRFTEVAIKGYNRLLKGGL